MAAPSLRQRILPQKSPKQINQRPAPNPRRRLKQKAGVRNPPPGASAAPAEAGPSRESQGLSAQARLPQDHRTRRRQAITAQRRSVYHPETRRATPSLRFSTRTRWRAKKLGGAQRPEP